MIKKITILFLLVIVNVTTLHVLACGCGGSKENTNISSVQQSDSQEQVTEGKVQCPVMKTWILPSEAADLTEYNGKTYYFCCGGCKEQFFKNPDQYINPEIKS